jgi:3-oxoacyl-[acyl-carrier protein] reductase
MDNYNSLSNKVVLINGGSRGIGAGMVKAFSQQGSTVYFTYNKNDDAAQDLVSSCAKNPGRVYSKKIDSRSAEFVEQVVKEIWKQENSIDILINNAAVIPRGLFLNISKQIWKDTMECNINGAYNYCFNSLKYMMKKKQGVIINISSVSGQHPGKGQAAYSTSKGAIESFTKVLALEYGHYNIRVNAIAPGFIETEIHNPILPEVKNEILKRTPLGRYGSISDITNATLFIASDNASYITGITLYVTGGRHLS